MPLNVFYTREYLLSCRKVHSICYFSKPLFVTDPENIYYPLSTHISISIFPRSRCQIFVSLCPGQVSPGSCDQLRVSWSLATFQTEAAPSVVHCPDIRDSGVGSYTVTLLHCYTRPAGGMPGMLGTTHNTAVTARNETGSSSYV